MILKEADDKSGAISELEKLLAHASGQQQKDIKRELAIMRAGIKGERESAYFLDFHFKNSKNSVLIHDLRIEHNGRVAQIDHLLLTRIMDFYVIETKHFSDGLKMDENEQFLRSSRTCITPLAREGMTSRTAHGPGELGRYDIRDF